MQIPIFGKQPSRAYLFGTYHQRTWQFITGSPYTTTDFGGLAIIREPGRTFPRIAFVRGKTIGRAMTADIIDLFREGFFKGGAITRTITTPKFGPSTLGGLGGALTFSQLSVAKSTTRTVPITKPTTTPAEEVTMPISPAKTTTQELPVVTIPTTTVEEIVGKTKTIEKPKLPAKPSPIGEVTIPVEPIDITGKKKPKVIPKPQPITITTPKEKGKGKEKVIGITKPKKKYPSALILKFRFEEYGFIEKPKPFEKIGKMPKVEMLTLPKLAQLTLTTTTGTTEPTTTPIQTITLPSVRPIPPLPPVPPLDLGWPGGKWGWPGWVGKKKVKGPRLKIKAVPTYTIFEFFRKGRITAPMTKENVRKMARYLANIIGPPPKFEEPKKKKVRRR